MTNQLPITKHQRWIQDLPGKLSLDPGREVELHTVAGHVITGKVVDLVWEYGDEWIEAVRIEQTSPAPTYYDDEATITYDRVVMLDHVFEIRPRLSEKA